MSSIERAARRRRAPIAALTALAGLFLCGPAAGPGPVLAQDFEPAPPVEEPVRAYDYYSRGTDPDAAREVDAVERNHLGRVFWDKYERRSWVQARAEAVFVVRLVPNHPVGLLLLELVSRQTGDQTDPIAFYERAIRLFPNRAATRARYGRYLLSIGQREAGLAELRSALAADSTRLEARAWYDEAVKSAPGTRSAP